MPSFCPVATVECTIADGFCQMMQFHMLATFQVGDGAGYFQNATVGSC